jgi:hypothetical protein
MTARVPHTIRFRSSARVFRSSASRSARNALLVLMCGPSLRLGDIWAISHTEPAPALAVRPSAIGQAPAGGSAVVPATQSAGPRGGLVMSNSGRIMRRERPIP